MANFRSRNDDELSQLTDEKLLEHMALARAAGHAGDVERALAIIVFRYHPLVEGRVRAGLYPRGIDDADDVIQNVMLSAIRSKLEGRTQGEFKAWLNRIITRRIQDYWRDRERDPDTTPLPDENLDDENVWGDMPTADEELSLVELDEIVEAVLSKLSAQHRRVVELFVFDGHSAEETCNAVNEEFPDEREMKVDNVSKIAERFRKDLRKALEEAERDPTDPGPDDEDADNPT